jgi:membrane-associated phospholipid phosphatase
VRIRLAVLLAVVAMPAAARAQATGPAPPDVSWSRDAAITAVALSGAALATVIPVDRTTLWQRQLLPIDDRLKGRLSSSAAHTSDVLAAVNVVMPFGLLVGQGGGLGDVNNRRLLLYSESIAVSIFLNGITKHLVGRPRPYAYSADPLVHAYGDAEGIDSHLSFFSGHAAITFTASVAGAYLYGQASTDRNTRAAVWAFELALAGATADLRTRAGKHFYSDVIVGALVGAAVGFAVPRLHGGPTYTPSAAEWVAIGVAPFAGIAIAEVLPIKPTIDQPVTTIALPWIAPGGGGGVMLARTF